MGVALRLLLPWRRNTSGDDDVMHSVRTNHIPLPRSVCLRGEELVFLTAAVKPPTNYVYVS